MRNTLIILALCVIAVALGAWLYFGHGGSAFQSSLPAPSQSTGTQTHAVSFSVIDSGMRAAAMSARKNYAIYTSAELADFWKKAHGDTSKLPLIDFSKNYVIAVFAGTEPSSGYAIKVTGVTDSDDTRSVAVAIDGPGSDCAVIEETTSPFEFVSVPVSSAENLSHTDEHLTETCVH